jgi:hypothetical protein
MLETELEDIVIQDNYHPTTKTVDPDTCYITILPESEPTTKTAVKEGDNSLTTSTASYKRTKTEINHHRRVMYRQRHGFMRDMVATIKLDIGTPVDDPANRKVVRKMVSQAIKKHKMHTSDATMIAPLAIEMIFLPSDAEIRASDFRRSATAKRRLKRGQHSKSSGDGFLLWSIKYLSNKLHINKYDPYDPAEDYSTPAGLEPQVTQSYMDAWQRSCAEHDRD